MRQDNLSRLFVKIMRVKTIQNLCFIILILIVCRQFVFAQIPTPSPTPPNSDEIKVLTEEIQLNVSVKNEFERFDPSLEKDDLLVLENREPIAVSSLRRIPASVLLVLDTGGENRLVKSFAATKATAWSVIESLKTSDNAAILEYHDKVNIIQNWTNSREEVLLALDKKLNFGRRSRFLEALNTAVEMFEKSPTVNRHLVLISDGTDTKNDLTERNVALAKLTAANVTVHILSWTAAERIRLVESGSIWQKGEPRPTRLPEEIVIAQDKPVQDILRMPRIGSINTDRAMIRARKERKESLYQSEKDLKNLAEITGGEILLPETREEMILKGAEVAKSIEANYVLTYIPKIPFSQSAKGEVRDIDVISRKQGIRLRVRKKITVRN